MLGGNLGGESMISVLIETLVEMQEQRSGGAHGRSCPVEIYRNHRSSPVCTQALESGEFAQVSSEFQGAGWPSCRGDGVS